MDIAGDIVYSFIFRLQPVCHFLIVRKKGKDNPVNFPVLFSHLFGGYTKPDQKIKGDTEDRQGHDEYNPGHLHGGSLILIVDKQYQDGCQDTGEYGNPFCILIQPQKNRED